MDINDGETDRIERRKIVYLHKYDMILHGIQFFRDKKLNRNYRMPRIDCARRKYPCKTITHTHTQCYMSESDDIDRFECAFSTFAALGNCLFLYNNIFASMLFAAAAAHHCHTPRRVTKSRQCSIHLYIYIFIWRQQQQNEEEWCRYT